MCSKLTSSDDDYLQEEESSLCKLFYTQATGLVEYVHETSCLSNEKERERDKLAKLIPSRNSIIVYLKRRKRQTLCVLLRVMLSDVQSTAYESLGNSCLVPVVRDRFE